MITYWLIIHCCSSKLVWNKCIFYLQLISLANNIKTTAKTCICSGNRKELRATVYLALPFTRNNHLATLMHYLIDKINFVVCSNQLTQITGYIYDGTFMNFLVVHNYLSYSFSDYRRMAVHDFFLSCFFIVILNEFVFFRKEHEPWQDLHDDLF